MIWRPGLMWRTLEHLATITGVTDKLLEAPENVAAQLTEQEEPADDKPEI